MKLKEILQNTYIDFGWYWDKDETYNALQEIALEESYNWWKIETLEDYIWLIEEEKHYWLSLIYNERSIRYIEDVSNDYPKELNKATHIIKKWEYVWVDWVLNLPIIEFSLLDIPLEDIKENKFLREMDFFRYEKDDCIDLEDFITYSWTDERYWHYDDNDNYIPNYVYKIASFVTYSDIWWNDDEKDLDQINYNLYWDYKIQDLIKELLFLEQ